MNSLCVISDLHGRGIWRDIVKREPNSKFIFLEDFFDSYKDEKISSLQEIENFKDIIAFKKANITKCIILFGNHAFHYLKTTSDRYARYNKKYASVISNLIHNALDEGLMKMTHIEGKYLFVHAGVSKTWCTEHNIDMSNLEISINNLFKTNPHAFSFLRRKMRSDPYGNNTWQSPCWIRPESLLMDSIDEYVQIVGHTIYNNIHVTNKVIFTDCLSTSKEYITIIDGNIQINKL